MSDWRSYYEDHSDGFASNHSEDDVVQSDVDADDMPQVSEKCTEEGKRWREVGPRNKSKLVSLSHLFRQVSSLECAHRLCVSTQKILGPKSTNLTTLESVSLSSGTCSVSV